jgi:hypothetical protein
MARIILGPLVSDARGKQGGLVFSRNAAGHYTRAKVSPIQPRTPLQMAIRNAMTYAAQYWRDTMTAPLRSAWEAYAKATPLTDRFGAKTLLSGIAMFLRFNAWWYVDNGSTLLSVAPTTPGEAIMETATLACTTADGLRASAVGQTIAAADRVLVQTCSAPTSQARNFFNGPWQQKTAWGNATAFPQVIIAPAGVAIGQRWWVRLRYFDNIGKVGPYWTGFADCTV